MQMKRCSDCRKRKALTAFHRNRHHRDGRQGACIPCHNVRQRTWRAKHPNYYQVRLARNPKYFRHYKLVAMYGITHEQYDRMLKKQGGKCAMCRKPPKGRKPLCVDHDHKTERVRALLCNGCNAGLHYVENKQFRGMALRYLARFIDASFRTVRT